MKEIEILLAEYNQLWNEKLIHKQSIRKFHHYLTYISAIASIALTFHGISATDFFKQTIDPQQTTQLITNARNIILMIFVPFTPILLLTLIFAMTDLFHIYTMGNHIGQLERRINYIKGKDGLLLWEHAICPVIYGNRFTNYNNMTNYRVTNIISAGDNLLLFPLLFILSIITTNLGYNFLLNNIAPINLIKNIFINIAYLYLALVVYMFAVIIALGIKLRSYTKPDGPLAKIIYNLSNHYKEKENCE